MILNLFNDTKRIIKKANKVLAKIKSYDFSSLSDEELKNKTAEFRERLKKGETLDDLQAEAYAVAGEAVHRELGFNIYDNQYISAYVIHDGNVAEASCGTGKTVVGYIASYLEALEGKGVYIITVNEYLAQRDAEECSRVYARLGMTVGLNKPMISPGTKKLAYSADVTYTTNSELGFDYLRDNMVTHINDKVQRELNFALIDEADSVLILFGISVQNDEDTHLKIYETPGDFFPEIQFKYATGVLAARRALRRSFHLRASALRRRLNFQQGIVTRC